MDSATKECRPARVRQPETVGIEMGGVMPAVIECQNRDETDFGGGDK